MCAGHSSGVHQWNIGARQVGDLVRYIPDRLLACRMGPACPVSLDPAVRITRATRRIIRLGLCRTIGVHETPSPIDLSSLAHRYAVSSSVVEDLHARRRAGARDAELINLLQEQDRGGLDPECARALIAELPER